ncbi:MAG TPA: cytochrome c oxidase subunit II [Acidimicrobiia bacterium]|jgi:cytochrome c oxidase subunit 2|nr:cytochrome c oxidase subunit II [Acidimicrobiia bacterium]
MLDRTQRTRRRIFAAVAAIAAVVVLAGCGDSSGPDNDQNALQPHGPYAKKILDLTRPFFWIAVVIGIGVTFATIYVALRFRVKPGEERAPVQVHGNTVLEVSWTIVPALILAVMAVPTVATIFDLAKKPTDPRTIHITVKAHQWWWEFDYEGQGKKNVVTANEMHIPVGVPVELSLKGPDPCTTANCYNNGVIHSFWIPELNGKKDVVPGRTQFLKLLAAKPGTYLGQCAEYCGLSHADMRMRVIAQSADDYAAWQRSQFDVKPQAELLKGVHAVDYKCGNCHSFEAGKAGAVAPNLTKLADRTAFAGDIYRMNYDNLWKWIYDAPGRKPLGPLVDSMPAFKDQGMTEAQAQEIACFLLKNTATNPQPVPGCPS